MTKAFPFSTTLRVRFNETDAQGHVNFVQYLNYFDVALVEYLRHINYGYSQMLDENLDMLYVDAHAAYHSRAYFDDKLRLHCRLGYVGDSSMRFDFQVFHSQDERLAATGEITAIMAEKGSFKKTRVPDRMRNELEVE